MRLVSSRPSGARTRGWPSVKLRGVHIGGRPDRSYPNGWASFWDEEYDQAALEEDVDLAVAMGANCVKLMSDISSYVDGGADLTRMDNRARDFLSYALVNDLFVCWAQPVPDWPDEAPIEDIRDAIVAIAATLDDFPNVVNFDCLSEINFYATASEAANNCAGIFPEVRAVTSIPLTSSLSALPNTLSAYVNALDEWVDFHEFHLYSMGTSGLLNDYIALTDRPFLLGEFGLGGYSTPESVAQQIEDFASPVSNSPFCHGAIFFPQYDAPDLDAGYPGLANVVTGQHVTAVTAFESLPGWT